MTDYWTLKFNFGINIQKKFSISYAWDKTKNCYMQKGGKFLIYTRNCEQKVTISIVESILKILPRHNGVIPIKITGQALKEHMAYFTTNDDSRKGKDPNINIVSGLHYIKGKTAINILVSNYTNKHITFNKGEYIGHLEPAIEDSANSDLPSHDQQVTHSTNSVTTQRMMAEEVKPNTFHPPLHKLKPSIESKLDALLKEYASQFMKDETSLAMTPLTEMTIDTGTSDPVFQKPYPIAMKNYQWVKERLKNYLQQRSYAAVDQVCQCQS